MRFIEGAFQCATVAHSRMVFSNGSAPEQLTALQLAQVMAASEVDQSHAFALLQEAKGFLQEPGSTVALGSQWLLNVDGNTTI